MKNNEVFKAYGKLLKEKIMPEYQKLEKMVITFITKNEERNKLNAIYIKIFPELVEFLMLENLNFEKFLNL